MGGLVRKLGFYFKVIFYVDYYGKFFVVVIEEGFNGEWFIYCRY